MKNETKPCHTIKEDTTLINLYFFIYKYTTKIDFCKYI